MKLSEILKELKANTFTCSTGAQLLAEQPTKDEVSHAHMHSLDPFNVDIAKIKPASFQAPSTLDVTPLALERQRFWQNPELHLNPKGAHPHQSQVFDPATKAPSTFKPYEFYVDETRLASNDTYLKRGMAEIAEQSVTTYSQKLIYVPSKGAKPTSADFPVAGKTDTAAVPTGGTLTKALPVQAKVTKIHPTYQKMEAHSMFEDSEVLVMSTSAAILSDAGLLMLTELHSKPVGTYLAVFSASAVKAVDAAFKKTTGAAPLRMVERTPASVSVNTTGPQPKLETAGATYARTDMKRVVLVVKKDASDDLIIVTCYPSQSDPVLPVTMPPTPPPTADDDVVEIEKGTKFQVVKQKTAIDLKW